MLEARSYQEGSLWFYAPNKGAPIAFAVLFALSGGIHFYQCLRYKSWKVTGLLPWSALLFTGGFITRTVGAFGQWGNIGIYIASSVLLLAGPPVYEGANYFILGRMLYYIPYHSPIHPGRVFTTFVAVGVAIEAITANGAVRVASSDSTPHDQSIGKALLKAALIMQLALMVAFTALAAKFQFNCSKGGVLNAKIKRCLIVLYISSTLITIRTIYRTVEYFTAANLNTYTDIEHISPVLKQEWFFWFFETVFMYSNSTLLNMFHPMQVLPRNNKIYLSQDGETEIEGPGYEDTRPKIATFVDPFDIYGLIVHRGKKEKYWETNEAQQVKASDARTPQEA
ncbi:RTA-like protein [Penicillium argentinense]|uniref:RTA-like protein n=1 Tax=Penicillium argentinense TaxID=1131581 RepID=A0A9W9KEI3_9EURO|nr:RTA-like protein [Penicillium argentinense]KAJ5103499.1 RTA-like protein [Penicillium argentinense]